MKINELTAVRYSQIEYSDQNCAVRAESQCSASGEIVQPARS